MKKQTMKNKHRPSKLSPTPPATPVADNVTRNGVDKHKKSAPTEKAEPLTGAQLKLKQKLEGVIRSSDDANAADYHRKIEAFHELVKNELWRPYLKFSTYARVELGYGRAASYRFAKAGEIFRRLSPVGDYIKLLTSDAHFRPLLTLSAIEQEAALALVEKWHKAWVNDEEVSPALVQSAVKFLRPAVGPNEPDDEKIAMARKFEEIIIKERDKLPDHTPEEFRQVITNLEKKAKALANPRRGTGIDWADKTWNPLQGCSRKSEGCRNCYAAKVVATRLADVYPGLATVQIVKGQKEYKFTGKIKLLPEELAMPLMDRTPSRIFVNSMSDLFHERVPDEFISAVFDVMEKAYWHQFQVLTKRADRMATFTQKRYADKEPPAHIWLGTSTEDQDNFDKRLPHLLNVKTAVRTLSIEPLLGPINLKGLDQIHWIVVGGESGSDRQMRKEWAISLRDQCAKEKVPFFFKQWGDFNEEGVKERKPKKDGLTPATLEGKTYDAYPAERVSSQTAAAAGKP